jgi:hypothetical protein
MSEPVKKLRDYLIAGGVLYLIGMVGTVLAWPSTGAYGTSSGSWFWTFLSAAAASVGGAIALIAIIGLGVKFGREAAEVD